MASPCPARMPDGHSIPCWKVFFLSQSTALREVWPLVYNKALQMTTWTNVELDNATLRRRILNSLQPGRMMVFMLDLQQTGAAELVLRSMHSAACPHCRMAALQVQHPAFHCCGASRPASHC